MGGNNSRDQLPPQADPVPSTDSASRRMVRKPREPRESPAWTVDGVQILTNNFGNDVPGFLPPPAPGSGKQSFRDVFCLRDPASLDIQKTFSVNVGDVVVKATQPASFGMPVDPYSSKGDFRRQVSRRLIDNGLDGRTFSTIADVCQVTSEHVAVIVSGLKGLSVLNFESGQIEGVLPLPPPDRWCHGKYSKEYSSPRCCCAVPDATRPLIATGGEELVLWDVNAQRIIASNNPWKIGSGIHVAYLSWSESVAYVVGFGFFIHDAGTAVPVTGYTGTPGMHRCATNDVRKILVTVGRDGMSVWDLRDPKVPVTQSLRSWSQKEDGAPMEMVCCDPETNLIVTSRETEVGSEVTQFCLFDDRKVTSDFDPIRTFTVWGLRCQQIERADKGVFVARGGGTATCLVSFDREGRTLAMKGTQDGKRAICSVRRDSLFSSKGHRETMNERFSFLVDDRKVKGTTIRFSSSPSINCWTLFF